VTTYPSLLSGVEAARFWSKVTEVGDCWEWQGANRDGYGHLNVNGRHMGAHRVAYEVERGPIPDGMVLDHLCRNPSCVRPDHLEPVRQRENLRRGDTVIASALTRTHCPHGHERTPANTLMEGGRRRCLICRRAGWQRTNARRRVGAA
jgi:hypothetical protein